MPSFKTSSVKHSFTQSLVVFDHESLQWPTPLEFKAIMPEGSCKNVLRDINISVMFHQISCSTACVDKCKTKTFPIVHTHTKLFYFCFCFSVFQCQISPKKCLMRDHEASPHSSDWHQSLFFPVQYYLLMKAECLTIWTAHADSRAFSLTIGASRCLALCWGNRAAQQHIGGSEEASNAPGHVPGPPSTHTIWPVLFLLSGRRTSAGSSDGR